MQRWPPTSTSCRLATCAPLCCAAPARRQKQQSWWQAAERLIRWTGGLPTWQPAAVAAAAPAAPAAAAAAMQMRPASPMQAAAMAMRTAVGMAMVLPRHLDATRRRPWMWPWIMRMQVGAEVRQRQAYAVHGFLTPKEQYSAYDPCRLCDSAMVLRLAIWSHDVPHCSTGLSKPPLLFDKFGWLTHIALIHMQGCTAKRWPCWSRILAARSQGRRPLCTTTEPSSTAGWARWVVLSGRLAAPGTLLCWKGHRMAQRMPKSGKPCASPMLPIKPARLAACHPTPNTCALLPSAPVQAQQARACLAAGAAAPTAYVFPARLQELAILQFAVDQSPEDARCGKACI